MADTNITTALKNAHREGQLYAWMGAQEMALLKALESEGLTNRIYRKFAEACEAEYEKLRNT